MRLTRSLVPVLVATAGLAAPLAIAPTAQAAAVTCGGLRATIVGNDRPNSITGTPKRDVINARGGNDTIRGLAGNDVICGGEGADRILGGEGDDRLYGEADLLRLDPYGRTLGYLFLNGTNYSLLVIDAGLAEESVSRYGDNGFPKEAAEVLAAAKAQGPPPFESPGAFRARMREVTKAMKARGQYPQR